MLHIMMGVVFCPRMLAVFYFMGTAKRFRLAAILDKLTVATIIFRHFSSLLLIRMDPASCFIPSENIHAKHFKPLE